MSYDTKYNAGTVSVTRSGDNSTNMNFSSQGSVAWAGGDFGLSKERQRSGIIVKTGLAGDGKLAAKVNNRNYVLVGNRTLLRCRMRNTSLNYERPQLRRQLRYCLRA
jgi:outer membrane usher protein FimD/PapC